MESQILSLTGRYQIDDDKNSDYFNDSKLSQGTSIEELSVYSMANQIQETPPTEVDGRGNEGKQLRKAIGSAFDKYFRPSYIVLVELCSYQTLVNEYYAVPLMTASSFGVSCAISLVFFGSMQIGLIADTVMFVFWLIAIAIPLVAVYCQSDDIRLQVR